MVYCGKPSSACQPCRWKRRRCDLEKPSCTQCLRAGVQCTGYRDAQSLSFRDQTATVSLKAQRKTNQKPRTRMTSCDSRCDSALSSGEQHCVIVPLYSLPFELETIATTYFLDFHVRDTPFAYLPQHWSRVANDDTVRAAVLPAAIAAFAFRFRQTELLEQALIHYSVALASTNNALCNRELATLDSTLLNILLLSMFEALKFRGRSLPNDWIMHVNGLSVILTLRGKEQFEDAFGRNLFNHASAHILANCAQSVIPVPAHFKSLQQYARSRLGNEDPGVKWGILIEGLVYLKTNMKGMLATHVIRKIRAFDSIAKELLKILSGSIPDRVHDNSESPSTPVDDSPSFSQPLSRNAARLTNSVLMFRLVFAEWTFCAFHTELRGVCLDHPSPEDPLHASWNQLPNKAMASFKKTLARIQSTIPLPGESLENLRCGTVRSLIWPLSTAAASEICPGASKLTIIKQLKDLALNYGIDQAREAAVMLEEGVPIESWMHMLQLS